MVLNKIFIRAWNALDRHKSLTNEKYFQTFYFLFIASNRSGHLTPINLQTANDAMWSAVQYDVDSSVNQKSLQRNSPHFQS